MNLFVLQYARIIQKLGFPAQFKVLSHSLSLLHSLTHMHALCYMLSLYLLKSSFNFVVQTGFQNPKYSWFLWREISHKTWRPGVFPWCLLKCEFSGCTSVSVFCNHVKTECLWTKFFLVYRPRLQGVVCAGNRPKTPFTEASSLEFTFVYAFLSLYRDMHLKYSYFVWEKCMCC